MPSAGLVARWETAYRQYGAASERAARSSVDDVQAAEAVACTSWQVAVLWREMSATPSLSWWALAALRAAAEVFEQQSHDWRARTQPPPPATGVSPDRRRTRATGPGEFS